MENHPVLSATGRIRGRVLFGYYFISALLCVVLFSVLWPSLLDQIPFPPLHEAGLVLTWCGFLFLLLWRLVTRRGGTLHELMGSWPSRPAIRWALMGGASLFCLNIGLVYAVYNPLWHLLPDWFRWWYTQDSAVIYSAQGDSNYLADSINLLILVLVGPLVEELFFRCLLLPSWVARWGVRTGVILSSLAFAGIHGDIVGAFIFAIAVSLAFLRTRKFWLVFIIHATHNALVWLFALGEMTLGYGSDAATPDFLLLGVASFLVGLSLLYVAVRRAPQSEPTGPE